MLNSIINKVKRKKTKPCIKSKNHIQGIFDYIFDTSLPICSDKLSTYCSKKPKKTHKKKELVVKKRVKHKKTEENMIHVGSKDRNMLVSKSTVIRVYTYIYNTISNILTSYIYYYTRKRILCKKK